MITFRIGATRFSLARRGKDAIAACVKAAMLIAGYTALVNLGLAAERMLER